MKRKMMKSKIHRAVITETDMDYEGSLTIDETLLEAADIMPYEQVHVYNITNGERFSTYAIKGEKDTGVIGVNGAAAHKASLGDLVIIVTFALMEEEECRFFSPRIVFVDKNNKIV
jgi:aspartate 1-decarboxylase